MKLEIDNKQYNVVSYIHKEMRSLALQNLFVQKIRKVLCMMTPILKIKMLVGFEWAQNKGFNFSIHRNAFKYISAR